jgi:hypothetical protein
MRRIGELLCFAALLAAPIALGGVITLMVLRLTLGGVAPRPPAAGHMTAHRDPCRTQTTQPQGAGLALSVTTGPTVSAVCLHARDEPVPTGSTASNLAARAGRASSSCIGLHDTVMIGTAPCGGRLTSRTDTAARQKLPRGRATVLAVPHARDGYAR